MPDECGLIVTIEVDDHVTSLELPLNHSVAFEVALVKTRKRV